MLTLSIQREELEWKFREELNGLHEGGIIGQAKRA